MPIEEHAARVGSNVADDLDGSVVRLPPCPKCKAEEFLSRSEVPPAANSTPRSRSWADSTRG
ncbi:MAG: hypothetical protein ACOZQL_23270 [Myxococcota bacterium]